MCTSVLLSIATDQIIFIINVVKKMKQSISLRAMSYMTSVHSDKSLNKPITVWLYPMKKEVKLSS